MLEQKKKYEENAEKRKRERILEEMSGMREVPEICSKSEKMAGERSKVEDRLMTIGKMWKEKKDRQAELGLE